jgi:hypothetical protein
MITFAQCDVVIIAASLAGHDRLNSMKIGADASPWRTNVPRSHLTFAKLRLARSDLNDPSTRPPTQHPQAPSSQRSGSRHAERLLTS